MSQGIPHINVVLEPVNAYIEHTKLADRDFSHAFGELIGSFVTALDRLREKSYLVYDVRDQLQANIENYGRILCNNARDEAEKTSVAATQEEATLSEVKLEIFPVTEKNEKIGRSSDSQQSELIASLSDKVEKLTHELNQARTTANQDTERIKALQNTIHDNENHISALSNTLKEKDTHINKLNTHIYELNAYVNELQKKIDELHASRVQEHNVNDLATDNTILKFKKVFAEEEDEGEEADEQEEQKEEGPEVEEEEEEEEVEPEVEEEEEPEVEEEEEPEVEEEEEEVMEYEYKGKRYYIENDKSGPVYECLADDSVGDEIGKIVNGVIMVRGPSIGKKSVWVKL